MKLITANKLNRFFNKGVLPKLLEKLDKTKVLKTMEEVSANTNPENVANALVVGELYNNLKGFEPILDETGKMTGYKTSIGGADTVYPFCNVHYVEVYSNYNNWTEKIETKSKPKYVYAVAFGNGTSIGLLWSDGTIIPEMSNGSQANIEVADDGFKVCYTVYSQYVTSLKWTILYG